MMKFSIELGIRRASLNTVAEAASELFGTRPRGHYSDYRGGDYFRFNTEGESAIIQSNRDCDDIAEEDHPDVEVLVIIDPTVRPDAVSSFFAGKFDCVVIRRGTYPVE